MYPYLRFNGLISRRNGPTCKLYVPCWYFAHFYLITHTIRYCAVSLINKGPSWYVNTEVFISDEFLDKPQRNLPITIMIKHDLCFSEINLSF